MIPKFVKTNVDITNLSNFKTPAKTKYFFEINNILDLHNLKKLGIFCEENKLKKLFVGSGTNSLFAFEEFDGVLILNNLKGINYNFEDKILEVYSSEKIWEVAEKLEKEFGNDLWHRFIGLPGSIGGAIFGNAGCFGLETENNLLEVEVYDLCEDNVKVLGRNDCEFDYRNSIFKISENYFIIRGIFDLSKKVEKYSSDVDNIKFREEIQPKGNSCGSFFKNPSKENSAGSLIESVGLKGFNHKGAYFSEKHANFLMSDGKTCTYKSLLELIEMAQNKVFEKHGIWLENEVRIIKN